MSIRSTTPTVVLVHGAFADSSSWTHVIKLLQKDGVSVQAVSNPLRGLTHDGDYVASAVSQIDGPVILVGHSYGGPVITHAGTKASNVKALVYVASFGVDAGVSALASTQGFPEADLGSALEQKQFPVKGGAETEIYIQKDRYPSVFAADLPADQAAALAVSQRPIAATVLGEPLGVEPAWKKLPSWFLVATQDRAINPDSQRAAAKRLGANAVEVEASHSVAASRPEEVAKLILEAVKAVSQASAS